MWHPCARQAMSPRAALNATTSPLRLPSTSSAPPAMLTALLFFFDLPGVCVHRSGSLQRVHAARLALAGPPVARRRLRHCTHWRRASLASCPSHWAPCQRVCLRSRKRVVRMLRPGLRALATRERQTLTHSRPSKFCLGSTRIRPTREAPLRAQARPQLLFSQGGVCRLLCRV